MPALWVETPQARLRLESERLILTLPAGDGEAAPAEHHLPLEEIERLILTENASITTPALCELLRRDIPVTLHDGC